MFRQVTMKKFYLTVGALLIVSSPVLSSCQFYMICTYTASQISLIQITHHRSELLFQPQPNPLIH